MCLHRFMLSVLISRILTIEALHLGSFSSLRSQTLGQMKVKDSEFKACLGNLVRPCLKLLRKTPLNAGGTREMAQWVRVFALNVSR